MSDDKARISDNPDANRQKLRRDDELHTDSGPIQQHGDALRDGSGSRQGQSPPVVDPARKD